MNCLTMSSVTSARLLRCSPTSFCRISISSIFNDPVINSPLVYVWKMDTKSYVYMYFNCTINFKLKNLFKLTQGERVNNSSFNLIQVSLLFEFLQVVYHLPWRTSDIDMTHLSHSFLPLLYALLQWHHLRKMHIYWSEKGVWYRIL